MLPLKEILRERLQKVFAQKKETVAARVSLFLERELVGTPFSFFIRNATLFVRIAAPEKRTELHFSQDEILERLQDELRKQGSPVSITKIRFLS